MQILVITATYIFSINKIDNVNTEHSEINNSQLSSMRRAPHVGGQLLYSYKPTAPANCQLPTDEH